jgi:REP element-mobilizing transposase RayT
MANTLAIMVTATTYGTWLRGDRRGSIQDGRLLPPLPWLEANDRARLKYEPFLFDADRLHDIGQMIGDSLIERMQSTILALHVARWHMHLIVAATPHDIADVVKCAKDAVRYGLKPGRPIWTEGYDKRFCFDEASLRNRIRYVERHNEHLGQSPRPWPFITPWPHLAPGH